MRKVDYYIAGAECTNCFAAQAINIKKGSLASTTIKALECTNCGCKKLKQISPDEDLDIQ